MLRRCQQVRVEGFELRARDELVQKCLLLDSNCACESAIRPLARARIPSRDESVPSQRR